MDQIRRFFGVERMGSTLEREFIAGAATFFSMSYIIVINPMLLAQAGIPYGAVFFATIISSVACTLFMGLFANVPYVLAPGMSLNSFVALTVVLLLGFRWQEALAMVFLCGLVNVFVTVTRLRHAIIEAIPLYLQNAISMGIGGFIAVAGVRNINVAVDDANRFFLFAGTVALLCVFYVLRLRGRILLGMMVMTSVCMMLGITSQGELERGYLAGYAGDFLGVVGAALYDGLPALIASDRWFVAFATVLALSLSDVFDTLGTFVGTGRSTGIFTRDEEHTLRASRGLSTPLDRALFADSLATPIGALLGTSNVTTYIESSAGISAGGRTGLTAVVAALFMLLAIFAAPIATAVPIEVNAGVLLVIGVSMLKNYSEIAWQRLGEAVPAVGTILGMTLLFSIAYGLAVGLFLHCLLGIVRYVRDPASVQVNYVLLGCTLIFVLNFLVMHIL